jgi:hypothetical protein
VRAAKLLDAPTIVGGCPGRGWWWRELKESNKPSTPPVIYKNGTKNGQFPALLDIKIAKRPVFYSKVLNKIYFQNVF